MNIVFLSKALSLLLEKVLIDVNDQMVPTVLSFKNYSQQLFNNTIIGSFRRGVLSYAPVPTHAQQHLEV